MNYASKTTDTSDVMPEVTFTLKKLSHGRRVKIDLALAEHRARIRELTQQFNAIGDDESDEARLEKLKLDSATRLLIEQHFKPAYLGEALAEVKGLNIDDEPATLSNLFTDGPAELIEEIYQVIQANVQLSVDEIKN